MTTHNIKLARARCLSQTASYPTTYAAILRHVPIALIECLTAAELARVIDAMYACTREAKALVRREAVAESVIWDVSHHAASLH